MSDASSAVPTPDQTIDTPKTFEAGQFPSLVSLCRCLSRQPDEFGHPHLDLRQHLGLLSKAVELSEPRFTYRVLRCLTSSKKRFQQNSAESAAAIKLIIQTGLPKSE